MAKRKATETRGSGIGSYLLTVLISAITTAVLIAALVLVTASRRSGGAVSVAAANQNPASTTVVIQSTATPEPSATPARTGVVAASSQSVNVRSGPGTGFEVVGTVQPGVRVAILGQNDDGTWQNIQLEDGTQGWVSTALLRLPQPTETPAVATQVVGSTPTEEILVVACEGNEASVWWENSAEILYTQAKWAIVSAQENQLSDIRNLYAALESRLPVFEEASFPPCVGVLRQNLIDGSAEVLGGLETYYNGDQNGGRNRVQNASTTYFEPTVQALTTELDVQVFTGECPVDAWLLSVNEPYTTFITNVTGFSPGGVTPDSMRPLIFETQRLRQRVDEGFVPDCAADVQAALLNMMDEGIAMFQGAFAGDPAAIETHQAAVVRARDDFRAAVTRLGYNVP